MKPPWSDLDVAEAMADVMLTGGCVNLANEAWIREQGREAGYPQCCVDEFVADFLAGRMPAQLRGSKNGYVPCHLHQA